MTKKKNRYGFKFKNLDRSHRELLESVFNEVLHYAHYQGVVRGRLRGLDILEETEAHVHDDNCLPLNVDKVSFEAGFKHAMLLLSRRQGDD